MHFDIEPFWSIHADEKRFLHPQMGDLSTDPNFKSVDDMNI